MISIKSKRFFSFLICQALGALNDNAFKVTIITLALARLSEEAAQARFSSIAGAMMPIPFLLFSPLAGYLADRFPKHRNIFWAKVPEFFAMLLSIWAFKTGNLYFLLFVFFLMCTQSSFFSPSKYGILPEVFSDKDLSNANGILELTTNVAILLGSVLGVLVYGAFKDHLVMAGVLYTAIAFVGVVLARFVPLAPEGNASAKLQLHPWKSFMDDTKWISPHREIKMTLLGIAYFYFLGALFLTLVPVFGKSTLGMPAERAGLLLAVLSIGIALGSGLAGRLSQGRVELGWVPVGSLGLAVFALALSLSQSEGVGYFMIFGIGVAGGLYIVPLKAYLQQRSPRGMKGRMISYSNMQTFGAVGLASLFAWLLTNVLALPVKTVLLVSAILTFVAGGVSLKLLPDLFVRLILLGITRIFYRIEVHGYEKVRPEGMLLVSNHVSWVDAILIATVCDRPVRFMMYRGFFEVPGLKGFFQKLGIIPISSKDTEEERERSFAQARERMKAGDLVGIFAEGAITRVGGLQRFKRGLEKISEQDFPIVPMYLDGIWGSVFSFENGKFFWKWPKAFPYKVRVFFGDPLPPGTRAYRVREVVEELSVQAVRSRAENKEPFLFEWARSCRRNWNRSLWIGKQERLTFGQAWHGVLKLRGEIFPGKGSERVGIAGVPGVETALLHMVAIAAGREPVHLSIDRPLEEADTRGMRRVLSLSEASPGWNNAPNGSCVFVDVSESISKIVRSKPAWFDLSLSWLKTFFPGYGGGRSPLATSEGERSFRAVLTGLRESLNIQREDRVLTNFGFHTELGKVAGLGLPMVSGASVCFDGSVPGNIWILNRPMPGRDETPSAVFVPALDSDETVAWLKAEKQIEPFFGWGSEEAGAVALINTHDFGEQVGNKPGALGRPIPGVATQIRSTEDDSVLPPGKKGLLWIRSAANGGVWKNTGEFGLKDRDGFVWVG